MPASAKPRPKTDLFLLHCCFALREAAERNMNRSTGSESLEWFAMSLGLLDLHVRLVAADPRRGMGFACSRELALELAERRRCEEEAGTREPPSVRRRGAGAQS